MREAVPTRQGPARAKRDAGRGENTLPDFIFYFFEMAWKCKKVCKKTLKKPRKRARAPRKLKKIIQKVIARGAEVKSVDLYVPANALTFYAGVNWVANNVLPVSPYAGGLSILQGTSAGTRIGNRVRLVSLKFKGSLYVQAYNVTLNPVPRPVLVKFWFYYAKNTPTVLTPPGTDWFQLGGSSTALTNSLVDLWAPVNADQYTVVKQKTFKLGYASDTGTGNQLAPQFFTNNDFKLNCNFSFNLTKYLPKIVKFNDNTANPSSRNLALAIQIVNADGSAPSSNSNIPGGMAYTLSVRYSDM